MIRLQPALWVSLLSDRITLEPRTLGGMAEVDGKEIRHRVNRDNAYFYGADLGFETHRWNGAALYGSLSWVDGGVRVAGGVLGGVAPPVRRRPPNPRRPERSPKPRRRSPPRPGGGVVVGFAAGLALASSFFAGGFVAGFLPLAFLAKWAS